MDRGSAASQVLSGAAGVDEALHEVPDVLFHRSERPV